MRTVLLPVVLLFCAFFIGAGSYAAAPDDAVEKLLAETQGPAVAERMAYVKRCEMAARQHSSSKSMAALCARIGDVYYDLDQLKNAGQWSKWYKKAAAADPALAANTPLGYRLQEFKKIALRKNLLAAAIAVYVFASLLLIMRIVRGFRTFDSGKFIKRLAVYLGIYLAAAAIVFMADAALFTPSVLSFVNGTKVPPGQVLPGTLMHPAQAFVGPYIPLGVMDASNRRTGIYILLLGFLPAAMAVFYSSFRKRHSRLGLSALSVLLCAALWTHFLIVNGSDGFFTAKAAVTKSRVVFGGEPEELLVKDPARALRANPDLLKSDNEDLQEFLEKHYPEGIPKK